MELTLLDPSWSYRRGRNYRAPVIVYDHMRRVASIFWLGVLVAACAGSSPASLSTVASSEPMASTSVSAVVSSTVPESTTSTTTEPDGSTRIQPIDPATLQPSGEAWELPGYLSDEHAVLPDGRLVLFSWEGETWHKGWVSMVQSGGERVTWPSPFTSGLRSLGFSPTLERVVLLSDFHRLSLLDPATGEIERNIVDADLDDDVPAHEAFMYADGSKVLYYFVPGYGQDRIGDPPFLRVADLGERTVGDPIELAGVVHGLVDLPSEMVRDPNWPYGEAQPGIAFDPASGRLFVAHADGGGLTVADVNAGEVNQVALGPQPSFWAGALSWLVPPAEAKGGGPTASMTAWFNQEHSRLFVTGSASDGWRHPETREFHATNTPLGLSVIDADTLELVETLELPVAYGVADDDAVAAAGTRSDLVFCDEVCQPGNNLPETEGTSEHSGLYIIDPGTLEVRSHHRPGTNFYVVDAAGGWLIAESYGADGDLYESIDLDSGAPAAQIPYGDHVYLVTEAGVFEYRFLD